MKVFAVADNVISPLGLNTSKNFDNLLNGKSGISKIDDQNLHINPFYAAKIDNLTIDPSFTYLENLIVRSITDVLSNAEQIDKSKTVLILSTTKGNIDLLNKNENGKYKGDRLKLYNLALIINKHFNLINRPLVISNACISGVSALLVGKSLIEMNQYENALVVGGDILSEFTISGFNSLMALSSKPCRPYDKERDGITLGEGCGTILLSKHSSLGEYSIEVSGGAQTNDANHISGPSRTGEGLKLAIEKTLKACKCTNQDIDFINAHGTATIFNDEMESIAFDRLNLSNIPMNSLKGYYGHTLGASGVIESIISLKQLQTGTVLGTAGFDQSGVSKPLNVKNKSVRISSPNLALKTASGFGGCNAAILFSKA